MHSDLPHLLQGSTPGTVVQGHVGGMLLAGRDYQLYVPPDAAHEPRPLVVMLHGCAQDAGDFAAGTRMNEAARERGLYVLYPEQSRRANPHRCWNWFKPSHQERGRGEAHLIATMVRQVMATHAIDASRVYVAGLSAGGAMAANLAAAYPELFAAIGVHSGLAAGAADDLQSALDAMKHGPRGREIAPTVPVIVFHGDADSTVNPENAERLVDVLDGGRGHWATEVLVGGQRRVTRRVLMDPATGIVKAEHWCVHGGRHAWFGGSASGTYTDPQGPDATGEMLRFFAEHARVA